MRILSKKRATDYERKLGEIFWENGFGVMRAPASSGTTNIRRPDLLVGSAKKNLTFAIEVKTSRQNQFYVTKKQLSGLQEFASCFGAEPYLAVKFVGKRMDFMFLKVPDDLILSKGESYRVDIDMVKEKAMEFSSLINQ